MAVSHQHYTTISALLIAQPTPASQSLLSYLQLSLTVYHSYSDASTIQIFREKKIDIAIIDEDRDSHFVFQALRWVRSQSNASIPIVVYSAQDNPEAIIAIMKREVDDYLLKDKSFNQVRASLISCLYKQLPVYEQTTASDDEQTTLADTLYGSSIEIKRTRAFVKKVAPTDASVMLFGESGTGKTLVARMIHEHSRRRSHNFRSINCGAIPDTLVESELFGSEIGAFTDAVKRHGVFTRAHRGTLFLDELGDLSILSQAKLLQAIEEKRYTPLGSEQEFMVDIRCISATNKDIKQMMNEHTFRIDLYYRMAILCHTIAPLRERTEDIVPIAWRFLRQHDANKFFTTAAVDKLMMHTWPGNIRELKNCIMRAAIMSEDDRIAAHDITF